MQGNNFRTADGLLTPLLRQADQRSFRRQRDHVKHDAGLGHHGLAERQRVAFRSPRHAQRCDIDQNLGCDPFGQGLPLKAILFCQRQAALAIAGRNDHVAETGITEGGNDGFPHAAATLNHHSGVGIEPMAGDQAFDRDVIGV